MLKIFFIALFVFFKPELKAQQTINFAGYQFELDSGWSLAEDSRNEEDADQYYKTSLIYTDSNRNQLEIFQLQCFTVDFSRLWNPSTKNTIRIDTLDFEPNKSISLSITDSNRTYTYHFLEICYGTYLILTAEENKENSLAKFEKIKASVRRY